MARVYISQSTIHGSGAFASVPMLPGEIVLRMDDSRVVTEDWPLDPTKEEREHHCDYLAGGKVVLMQPPIVDNRATNSAPLRITAAFRIQT